MRVIQCLYDKAFGCVTAVPAAKETGFARDFAKNGRLVRQARWT